MCFFSVGRVCSDPLLLGSEANWVGWLGLVGDGRAGWLVRLVRLAGTPPPDSYLCAGSVGERGKKRLGEGLGLCDTCVFCLCFK